MQPATRHDLPKHSLRHRIRLQPRLRRASTPGTLACRHTASAAQPQVGPWLTATSERQKCHEPHSFSNRFDLDWPQPGAHTSGQCNRSVSSHSGAHTCPAPRQLRNSADWTGFSCTPATRAVRSYAMRAQSCQASSVSKAHSVGTEEGGRCGAPLVPQPTPRVVSVVGAQQARRGAAGTCTACVSCTRDGLPLSSGLPTTSYLGRWSSAAAYLSREEPAGWECSTYATRGGA